MLACWDLATLSRCHFCLMWGSACSSGEQPMARSPQGRSPDPGATEKGTNFGLR